MTAKSIPIVLRSLLLVALVGVSWSLVRSTLTLEAESVSAYPVLAAPAFARSAVGAGDPEVELGAELLWPLEKQVRRGQTLSGLFIDLGLDRQQSQAASRAAIEHLDPRTLRAGSTVTAYLSPREQLERVVFRPDERSRVEISRSDAGWRSSRRLHHVERRPASIRGRLEGALESSVRTAGAPGQLAYLLADVFQWDLDFNRDLRTGDEFEVVFDEVWIEGERARVGEVHAARYWNRGALLEAYRFDDRGYYDGEGRPLRKQFLRSPLPYSRVTSGFSHRRFHPILKVYRPHLGVDYGAPTGTPVRATASGVVRSASWSKGGGKTVKIRHPNGYTTAYLHLSGYAEGIRRGRRVAQGEVIGYVGATGLATAPHLDYRIAVGDRWMNPLALQSEPAPPLEPAELRRFRRLRDELRERFADSPATPTPEGGRAIASDLASTQLAGSG